MVERRTAENFNWPLLLVTATIMVLGLVNLFSASQGSRPAYFYSQLIWAGLSVSVAVAVVLLDYMIHEKLAYAYYGLISIALCVVYLFASIKGSHRWIDLGPINFQPSEFAKLGLVFALARWFHDDAFAGPYGFKRLFQPAILTVVPAFLIFWEPDLGTTILICLTAAVIFLFVRVKIKSVLVLALVLTAAAPPVWTFALKDYQKQRVLSLLDPEADTKGEGYHRRQSIIAIGSGGWTGKGFTNGTQTQLQFLPEHHTDFIFSVWAEERGFLGSAALLLLYLAMVILGLRTAVQARERFGAITALGCTMILFWQIFINIGMVVGLLPVVGVTLPFMSYGGNSYMVCTLCVGLLLNISMRKYVF